MSNFNEDEVIKTKKRLNFYLVSTITLLTSKVILASLCWYTAIHQKTEITPFFGEQSYIKSDTSIDGNYLSQLSENFVNARLNVTPHNIKENHKRLLNFVNSSVYHKFSSMLLSEQKKIIKQKISSYFDIESIEPMPSKLKVKIKGNLRRFVGSSEIKPQLRTYEMNFKYHLGRLSIIGFEVKEVKNHD